MSMDTHWRSGRYGPAWLFNYQREWLPQDLLAGLIAAAVVIPKAMAYATVAGLPVQVGLYTALVPMAVYALVGSSRPLSVSTTTTIAILVGSEIQMLAPGGDVASAMSVSVTLALMVGIFLMLASFLRMGFLANFISEPVLVGFKAGIAVVIVLDQLPKLLGVHIPKDGFALTLYALIRSVPDTSIVTFAVGAVMIGMLVGIERIFPRAPAPLIAVAAGIVGMRLLGLESHGVESVGHIPQGPPALTLPNLGLAAQLWPGALGIALMSFTESIAAGRAFAAAEEPLPRPNVELFATGLASAAGAFAGAMPSGGGTTQTAVNRLAGARTQVAELVTAGATLLTMLLLAPLIGLMPQATLAAVVIVYSIGLIRPVEFRTILRVRRTEFVWALVAFSGVILLGTLQGILVAIITSLGALAWQTFNPPVHMLGRKPGTNVFRPLSRQFPDDETFPGLLLAQLEGRVFFANAERIAEKIRLMVAETKPGVVALDFSGVPDIEYTALKMLTEAEKRQRRQGVMLWLVGLNPEVLALVRRTPLGEALGRERMLFNLACTVDKYQQLVARENPADRLSPSPTGKE